MVAEIRSTGGKADFLSGDLRDAGAVRALARQAIDLGGGHVDILVNNAAVYPAFAQGAIVDVDGGRNAT